MSDDLTLELEVDLPLEDADIDRYRAYIASGMAPRVAAMQTAQDLLGGMGAIVQHAEAVRS